MREPLDRLGIICTFYNLRSLYGAWHLDDDPDSIMWSAAKPHKDDKQLMRDTINEANKLFAPESNIINDGAWQAVEMIGW